MLNNILKIIVQRASKRINIKKYWIDCTYITFLIKKSQVLWILSEIVLTSWHFSFLILEQTNELICSSYLQKLFRFIGEKDSFRR